MGKIICKGDTMKRKNVICVLLALCLTLCLCACGGEQKTAASSSEADKTASSGEAEKVTSSGEADKTEPVSGAEKTVPGDEPAYPDARIIELSGDSAKIDEEPVEVFDYTWHCDPSVSHDEVKNAPAEYYTGTKPETDAAVYIDHELYYFPELPESGFQLVNYDGEREWAYYYTDGEHDDYIFATLPSLSAGIPSDMMHSPEEAAENSVLHITESGTYILKGEWHGQIRIDLGDKDETFTDESACAVIVLGGVNIECTAAPALLFYSAYECDNAWEERGEYSEKVSTENAGATVIIADGSENTVSGTNVFRMLKTAYKDSESADPVKLQKKMRKTDGALYSYVTMNITGEKDDTGSLTVNSGFEGIDSELHLNFSGGNITVNSQDDGINVNEDDVSVVSFTGGHVTLNAGLGAEGDGVDSNGYIVVDGGEISVNGVVPPDSALDSEDGIYYQSGTVVIDGVEQEYSPGDVFGETGRMGMPQMPGGMQGQMPGGMQGQGGFDPGRRGEFAPGEPGGFGGDFGADFDMAEFKEKVAALPDDAGVEDVLEILGFGGQWGDGRGMR